MVRLLPRVGARTVLQTMTPLEAEALWRRARCVHDAEAVAAALDQQAKLISARLADSDPLLVAVMTGGMWLAVELSRRLTFPHQLDYLHVTRYHGAARGGELQWRVRPRLALAGRTVLIVEDILDEGHTLAAVVDACRRAGAHRVYTAVLVGKRHQRRLPGVAADFQALEVDDCYVFGCGMDAGEYWRGLPAIYAVEDGQPPAADTGHGARAGIVIEGQGS